MTESSQWCWVDRDGVQRIASTKQIREAITAGVIASDAMLWRRGMQTFQSAGEISEFRDLAGATPAANPGGQLVGAVANDPEAQAAWKRTCIGMPAPDVAKANWQSKAALDPDDPPTLVDGMVEKKTRLAGSNPAPIVVPSPDPNPPSAITLSPPFPNEEKSPAGAKLAVHDIVLPVRQAPLSWLDDNSAPTDAKASAPSPEQDPPQPLPSVPASRGKTVRMPSSRAEAAPKSDPAPSIEEGVPTTGIPKHLLLVLAGAVFVCFAVIAAVSIRQLTRKQPAAPQPPPSAVVEGMPAAVIEPAVSASASATPAPKAPQACVLSKKAQLLGRKARKDVLLEIASAPSSKEIAIGFASEDRTASGFVVDTTTLDAKVSHSKKVPGLVHRVVPVVSDGEIAFEAQSADAKNRESLAVATSPVMYLSWDRQTLMANVAGSTPTSVWESTDADKPEAMRALAVGDDGLAVAFRMSKAIWLGWIGRDGKRQGEIAKLPGGGVQVGSPSIGWNGKETVVVFAERAEAKGPWGVRVVRAAFGEAPSTSVPWTIPDGGPGGAAIAPSVHGLKDGRWVLVWTEGGTGRRDVRVQTLDEKLSPLGQAFTASEEPANAGQGVVAVAEGKGIVAYLSERNRSYELWATRVECP